MKELRIAIVGSRETEPAIMEEMFNQLVDTTTQLLKRGHSICYTSGGCKQGPDQLLFRLGHRFTNQKKVRFVCYLESDKKLWLKNYNSNVEFIACTPTDLERALIAKHHPAPDKLSDWMWLLHCRNVNIMTGYPMSDKELVDAVFYHAPIGKDGLPTGGTRTGVAYARSRNVPCFNYPSELEGFLKLVNNVKRS